MALRNTNMKNLLKGFGLGAVLLLLVAAAGTTKYVGTFVGNGVGITNVTASTLAAGATISGAANGIEVAVRRLDSQTADILAVQTQAADLLWSIGKSGCVQMATNNPVDWPAAPATRGGCAIINSNGTVYLFTSAANGNTWAATNKLAP